MAVRTQAAYILSSQYHAHWFEDSALFSNPVRHAKIQSKIDKIEDDFHMRGGVFEESFVQVVEFVFQRCVPEIFCANVVFLIS